MPEKRKTNAWEIALPLIGGVLAAATPGLGRGVGIAASLAQMMEGMGERRRDEEERTAATEDIRRWTEEAQIANEITATPTEDQGFTTPEGVMVGLGDQAAPRSPWDTSGPVMSGSDLMARQQRLGAIAAGAAGNPYDSAHAMNQYAADVMPGEPAPEGPSTEEQLTTAADFVGAAAERGMTITAKVGPNGTTYTVTRTEEPKAEEEKALSSQSEKTLKVSDGSTKVWNPARQRWDPLYDAPIDDKMSPEEAATTKMAVLEKMRLLDTKIQRAKEQYPRVNPAYIRNMEAQREELVKKAVRLEVVISGRGAASFTPAGPAAPAATPSNVTRLRFDAQGNLVQ